MEIYILISKEENEIKINAEFNKPELKLDFCISNIEDIKNIFNFEASYVHLNANYNEGNNMDIYNKVKDLLNEIQKGKEPAIYIGDENENNEDKPHIIIDNGSSYFKAGLSGEGFPRAVFSSCVGYPKYSGMMDGDYFVGFDAEDF